MVTATTFHAQTQGRDLGALYVDPGRAQLAFTIDAIIAQYLQDTLLDAPHQLLHAHPFALKVDQHVGDDLAGAVIGNLAAAIGLNHRYRRGLQQMLGLARETLGIDRRMLQQPNFVARFGVALRSESLHRVPRGFVIGDTELPDRQRRREVGQ